MMNEGPHPFHAADHVATPLTNDERAGLIPSWVIDREEINEVEQANVAEGTQWAFRQRRRELLDERFLRDLHKRMFGDVRPAGRCGESRGRVWLRVASNLLFVQQ